MWKLTFRLAAARALRRHLELGPLSPPRVFPLSMLCRDTRGGARAAPVDYRCLSTTSLEHKRRQNSTKTCMAYHIHHPKNNTGKLSPCNHPCTPSWRCNMRSISAFLSLVLSPTRGRVLLPLMCGSCVGVKCNVFWRHRSVFATNGAKGHKLPLAPSGILHTLCPANLPSGRLHPCDGAPPLFNKQHVLRHPSLFKQQRCEQRTSMACASQRPSKAPYLPYSISPRPLFSF